MWKHILAYSAVSFEGSGYRLFSTQNLECFSFFFCSLKMSVEFGERIGIVSGSTVLVVQIPTFKVVRTIDNPTDEEIIHASYLGGEKDLLGLMGTPNPAGVMNTNILVLETCETKGKKGKKCAPTSLL